MSAPSKNQPSFSTANRWRIGFDVVLRTLLVVAVAGMLNYLGARFVYRFHWSAQTQTTLAPRSLAVLHTLTNHVDVTLYYDRSDDFYPDIVSLLKEYSTANKNIVVRTVDYLRDAGAAEAVMKKYGQHFPPSADTNLVIFDCGGHVQVVTGDKILNYQTKFHGVQEQPGNAGLRQLEFERKIESFNGEQLFTSSLLAVANAVPLKAYYLRGHKEISLTDADSFGFQKFAQDVVLQNSIELSYLDAVGGSGVPADCNLLIIGAPSVPYGEEDLQQISRYLREGGHLLVMLAANSQGHPTGLEDLLRRFWNVDVKDDVVQDFTRTTTSQGYDVVVDQYGRHPLVNGLRQVQLELIQPRPVLKIPASSQAASAPEVDELFGTTPAGKLVYNAAEPPHAYALACAVEQKPVTGVATPRGNTRIVVVGDATFLANGLIDRGGNRDFLDAALNWLCDRTLLVEGVGPRPVTDFRLHITRHQQRQLSWLLLAALPGGVLGLGCLVWLVRRK
jgi:hypothetical protein